jgi:hypothetical protein
MGAINRAQSARGRARQGFHRVDEQRWRPGYRFMKKQNIGSRSRADIAGKGDC